MRVVRVRLRVRTFGVSARRIVLQERKQRHLPTPTTPRSNVLLPLPLALRFVKHVVNPIHLHNDAPQHGLVAVSYAVDLW